MIALGCSVRDSAHQKKKKRNLVPDLNIEVKVTIWVHCSCGSGEKRGEGCDTLINNLFASERKEVKTQFVSGWD